MQRDIYRVAVMSRVRYDREGTQTAFPDCVAQPMYRCVLPSIAIKSGDPKRERETPVIIVIIVVILCSADIRPSGNPARSRFASDCRLLTNKLCHNGLIGVAARMVGMLLA